MANRSTARNARKKYGAAWKNVTSGSRLSIQLPRFQPMIAPIAVPSTKLITVATPIRPSVHGMPLPMMPVLTGANPLLIEMPKLPCSTFDQKWVYWPHRLALVPTPNCRPMAAIVA